MYARVEKLKDSPLFKVCKKHELEHIVAPGIREVKVKARDFFFRKGEQPEGIYVLQNGRVKLIDHTSDDRVLATEIAINGDILASEDFINETPYHLDAQAMEDSEALFIPINDFKYLLKNNQHLAQEALRMTCEKLKETHKKLLNFSYQPVRQRVAESILYYFNRVSGIQTTHPIEFSRSNLAHLAGVRRETATRLMKEFEKEGLVKIDKQQVQLLKPELLEEISKQYC